jgi:hypothetical protein
MARVTHVKAAQQRYETVPVIDPETGEQKRTPVMRKNGTQKVTKTGKPVFLRVTREDRSKPKPNRKCDKCGVEIKVGDPYKHVTPKSGPYGGHKRARCAACPTWKPSELSSSKMAGIYAAQEDLDVSSATSADELTEAANDFAQAVRDVASEYQESADNIEDGFGHSTYISEELADKASELESWADEIESLDFADAPDEDDFNLNEEGEEAPEGEDFDEDEYCYNSDGETYDDALSAWQDEEPGKLTDAASECPV